MRKLLLLAATATSVVALPAVALLAIAGLAGSLACAPGLLARGGALSPTAPVPAAARAWVTATHAACPDLPPSWIAAVMAQESGFRPDAYADDRNGGTWGLFQLNAAVWRAAYGGPWTADRDRNGVWDVKDPAIHARVAGAYLCDRLAGVRRLRAAHPDWASTRQLGELDALIVAHNAGESRLRAYPAIPAVTARFIADVRARAMAWSAPSGDDGESAAVPADCPGAPPAAAAGVTVRDGTPADVAAAVRTSMSYVGVRSGWSRMCDRLACRAYGYANSGYPSAAVHWRAMLAAGHARLGDRCPPVGSFVFWRTGTPLGHVALVVANTGGCDPSRITVVSNDVLDRSTGNHGGVYAVSLAQIESGYVTASGYLGWSQPICAGKPLPTGTRHPVATRDAGRRQHEAVPT